MMDVITYALLRSKLSNPISSLTSKDGALVFEMNDGTTSTVEIPQMVAEIDGNMLRLTNADGSVLEVPIGGAATYDVIFGGNA